MKHVKLISLFCGNWLDVCICKLDHQTIQTIQQKVQNKKDKPTKTQNGQIKRHISRTMKGNLCLHACQSYCLAIWMSSFVHKAYAAYPLRDEINQNWAKQSKAIWSETESNTAKRWVDGMQLIERILCICAHAKLDNIELINTLKMLHAICVYSSHYN